MENASRPFVHINCASSLDGRIALPGGRRIVLSSPWDKRRVHLLRQRYGAVLVGVGTVLSDDPKLHVNPHHTGGSTRPLTRVILDSSLRTPPGARLFSYPGEVLIYCAPGAEGAEEELRRAGARLTEVPRGEGGVDLKAVLEDLRRRGVEALLVEGGSRVISSFLKEHLFDLLTIFVSPVVIGSQEAPSLCILPSPTGPVELHLEGAEIVEGGVLLTLRP